MYLKDFNLSIENIENFLLCYLIFKFQRQKPIAKKIPIKNKQTVCIDYGTQITNQNDSKKWNKTYYTKQKKKDQQQQQKKRQIIIYINLKF